MKICLFGSASEKIDKKYNKEVFKLAEEVAKRGHTLVFGGGAHGLMGEAAKGVKSQNGELIGVYPRFFKTDYVEVIFDGLDKEYTTDTLYERKQTMEKISDGFLIVPGGVGTLDEFFGVLTSRQLSQHKKPIAIFNPFGFYTNLGELLSGAINEKFVESSVSKLYKISDNIGELLDYLENPPKIDGKLKEG